MLGSVIRRKSAALFKLFDADGDGYWERSDFEQFVERLSRSQGLEPGSAKREALSQAWAGLWDAISQADADGDGRLTLDEILAFQEHAFTPETVSGFARVLFPTLDANDDGAIGMEEYRQLLALSSIDPSVADGLSRGWTPTATAGSRPTSSTSSSRSTSSVTTPTLRAARSGGRSRRLRAGSLNVVRFYAAAVPRRVREVVANRTRSMVARARRTSRGPGGRSSCGIGARPRRPRLVPTEVINPGSWRPPPPRTSQTSVLWGSAYLRRRQVRIQGGDLRRHAEIRGLHAVGVITRDEDRAVHGRARHLRPEVRR